MMIEKPIIGIDYGDSHIGIAIATDSLAEPITVIPTNSALKHIQNLISQRGIKTVVVGLSENHMAEKTKAFASMLKEETGLPLYFHDETLSSFETRVNAARAGMPKKRRQQRLDHLAAASILQDFLDSGS